MASKADNDYLKRLPRAYYRGLSFVHWTMVIEGRQSGWLSSSFHRTFRELLTHAAFRYQVACPIYCCMPDHIHLMWLGLHRQTDQLNAVKYFRRYVNLLLAKADRRLQSQAHDHVLRESEIERQAFEEVCEYIARNPERKSLVPLDRYSEYSYTGSLVPGAPELRIFDNQFWDSFWAIYSHVVRFGLFKTGAHQD